MQRKKIKWAEVGDLWMETGEEYDVGQLSTIFVLENSRPHHRNDGPTQPTWKVLAVTSTGEVYVSNEWFPRDEDVKVP